MDRIRIACPHCSWEPDGGRHWYCACGAVYDVFATNARCPKCTNEIENVQCMPSELGGCHRESPYMDWIRGLDELVEEMTEAEFTKLEGWS